MDDENPIVLPAKTALTVANLLELMPTEIKLLDTDGRPLDDEAVELTQNVRHVIAERMVERKQRNITEGVTAFVLDALQAALK